MHGSSFNDTDFVPSCAKELLKLKNTINSCLNKAEHYSLSLNTCECLICQIYQ